jgi:glycosyltransferase involved in cell wall biosynthesis
MRILVDGQTFSTPEIERGIGKAFTQALEAMLEYDCSHSWFLIIRRSTCLDGISETIRDRIQVIELPDLVASGGQVNWCRAYGKQVGKVVRDLNVDVYWNPNPLMLNVHYPLGLRGVRIFVTLHDLIPLVYESMYLQTWPQHLQDDYRSRLDEISASGAGIIAVSRSGLDDWNRFVGSSSAFRGVVHWGVDHRKFYPSQSAYALADRSSVLYVGGFDPRKNMEWAVMEYAAFYHSLPSSEERPFFRIVCATGNEESSKLVALATSLGIRDEVELTGYVSDEKLQQYIQASGILFFPSLYEGFGIPVLDALACGVPVAVSKTSSLPEICGNFAVYFDPTKDGDGASALAKLWQDRDVRREPWREVSDHAASFTWERVASEYLSVFAFGGDLISSEESIAMVCPWPPTRSGVADYCYKLVKALAKSVRTVVYTPSLEPVALEGVKVLPLERLARDFDKFRNVFYHIGNGMDHVEIFKVAWERPGISVFHDYNIHPFTQFAFQKQEPSRYENLLRYYGELGVRLLEEVNRFGFVPWQAVAMSEPLAARSRGVLVHSGWVRKKLELHNANIAASYLGVDLVAPEVEVREVESSGLSSRVHTVGVFGFVNKHKRIDAVFSAISKVQASGIPVQLWIVGEVNDPDISLATIAKQAEVSDETWTHQGYVPPERFDLLMRECDVVVNLRYPTMGESSASLMHALSLGKPSIVSDVGQFAELPTGVVLKCSVGEDEVDHLATQLCDLFMNPALRMEYSRRALDFVRFFASFDRISEHYSHSW